MVPTNRRSLLVAGGFTLAAGCLSRADDTRSMDETTTTDGQDGENESLPDGLVTALGAVPSAIEGNEATRVYVLSPEEEGRYGAGLSEQYGLGLSDIDRAVAATYGDRDGQIVCLAGSFSSSDIDAPDNTASTTTDGRHISARGLTDGGAWDAGLDAARAAAKGSIENLSEDESVTAVLKPLTDEQYVRVFRGDSDENRAGLADSLDADSVDATAYATTQIEERTRRITTVVLFDDESSVDESKLQSMVDDNWGDGVEEQSIEQDGRRGVVTVVYERPPRPDYEASPDARLWVKYDDETGEATLRHRGDEAVDASTLTIEVEGEEAPVQFEDEYDTVENGDEITVTAAPFSHVRVRWEDPDDEETFDYLAREIVHDRSAFEPDYDPDTSELTITYTGEQQADTEGLELQHRSRDDRRSSENDEVPLSEYHETLTTGDEIVIEDVTLNDWVSVMATVTEGNSSYGTSVFSFHVRPPGYFYVRREDQTTYLVYGGDHGRSAIESDIGKYQVLVDDERASTQFGETYDELSEGDRIELDADIGSEVSVEWTGSSETVEMTRQTVLPDVSVELERVDGDKVEVTHDGGEPVDAGKISVAFPTQSGENAVNWGESGTTVEEGDSITVDIPDDARYVIVRYGSRTFTGRNVDDIEG